MPSASRDLAHLLRDGAFTSAQVCAGRSSGAPDSSNWPPGSSVIVPPIRRRLARAR